MPAAAIVGAAVVGAGASIVAGNKAAKAQTNAANTAADAQLTASRESNALQERIYNQNRADLAPWRDVGKQALTGLADMYINNPKETAPVDYSGFETSPGYQFRVDQATQAIERSAAAKGVLRSGGTLKGINRYVQGEASNEWDRWVGDYWRQRNYTDSRDDAQGNRLAALAGVGQSATGTTAQSAQNYAGAVNSNNQNAANGVSQAAIAAGNAQAGAYANTANAVNGTVQNLASMYLYNKGYGAPAVGGGG